MSKPYKRIYIGGNFDTPHSGHIELLRKASELAEEVVVALNTDEFAKRYKGKFPVMSLEERYRVISAIKYVSWVDINDGCEDSKSCILRNKPDAILHGDDWTGGSLATQMGLSEEFLKENKITMVYVPYTKGISTTEVRNRVKNEN